MKRCARPIRFALLWFVIVSLVPLWADRVLLRNGTAVEGRVTRQTRTGLTIQTANGTRVIPRARIRRIVYGAFDVAAARKKAERAALRRKKLQERQDAAREERQERAARQAEAEADSKGRGKLEARDTAGGAGLRSALGRSMILPGWGQATRQDRRAAGLVYAGGFLFGLVGAAALQPSIVRFTGGHAEQERLLTVLFLADASLDAAGLDLLLSLRQERTQRTINATHRAQAGLGLLAGMFYLANLGDVILAHPSGNALRLSSGPHRLDLALELRF